MGFDGLQADYSQIYAQLKRDSGFTAEEVDLVTFRFCINQNSHGNWTVGLSALNIT